jgi:hypothetical protein
MVTEALKLAQKRVLFSLFNLLISPLSLQPKIITHWLQSFQKKPTCTGTN